MKKILWISLDRTIAFNVNWFEYIVLGNILKKRKYIIKKNPCDLRGKAVDCLIVDGVVGL